MPRPGQGHDGDPLRVIRKVIDPRRIAAVIDAFLDMASDLLHRREPDVTFLQHVLDHPGALNPAPRTGRNSPSGSARIFWGMSYICSLDPAVWVGVN